MADAVQARHEEALLQAKLAQLQARCTALASISVDPLDEAQPAHDFRRWQQRDGTEEALV